MEYVKAPAELNATAASLLGFLHRGSMSGWDLAQTVAATIGNFWNVTRSQIYRELRVLAERGYVEVGDTGPRDRVPYTITEAGREAFEAWIASDPGPDLIRSPFMLKFFFAALLDEETLRRFVDIHRAAHEQYLAYFRDLLPKIVRSDPAPAHVLRFAMVFEESLLAWLDSIPWGRLAAEDLD